MKLEMVKRNALIAAGNALKKTEIPELRAKVEEMAKDEGETELVRETAAEMRTAGRTASF